MKSITLAFFLLLIAILYSSCRIEKRLYSNGYYFDRKGNTENVSSYSERKSIQPATESVNEVSLNEDSVITSTDSLATAKINAEVSTVPNLKQRINKSAHQIQASPAFNKLPEPVKSKMPDNFFSEEAVVKAVLLSVFGLIAVLLLFGLYFGITEGLDWVTILFALLSPFIILLAIWMGFAAISAAMDEEKGPVRRRDLAIAIGALLLAIVDLLLFFLIVYLFLL